MANNGNPDALSVVAGSVGECGICHVINRPAGTKQQPTTEHPHNAQLIAAAPELLEALKEIHKLWCCPSPKRMKDWEARCDVMDDYARKAIKKAEGTT